MDVLGVTLMVSPGKSEPGARSMLVVAVALLPAPSGIVPYVLFAAVASVISALFTAVPEALLVNVASTEKNATSSALRPV